MTTKTGETSESPAPQREASKQPYEPPRILFCEKLEAVAAVCNPDAAGKAAAPCIIISS